MLVILKESDFRLLKETISELVDLAYKCHMQDHEGAMIYIETPYGKLTMDITFKVEI